MNVTKISLATISVMSILLLSGAAVPMAAAQTSSGANEMPLYVSQFYSSTLPGGQLSPYCNVGSASAPFVIICYTPQDLKRAYNFPSTSGFFGLDGSGQTIVIIDAFGSPTVQSDLNTFDSEFNLPPTTIQIVCQNNLCPVFDPTNPDEVGWTQEIALDTQYAHAMAPGAHIVLFVTTSDDDLVMAQGAQQAIQRFPHSIISQSWGDPEEDLLSAPSSYVSAVLSTSEAAYQQAAKLGTTVFASAGDWGADNSPLGFTSANPGFPSSSPWVTSVGGTQGNPYYLGSIPSCKGLICSTGLVTFLNNPACQLNSDNPTATATCIPAGYGGEQVWNEPYFVAATGGAPSLIFSAPSYQHGLGLTMRGGPDVSYNAAISGGVLAFWSVVPSAAGFYIFGGTSAGSPQWSAIAALADQLASRTHHATIGFINPAVYSIGHNPFLYSRDFHDITVGNNIIAGSTVGFSAHHGWDDASGWGTPNVSNLIQDLV